MRRCGWLIGLAGILICLTSAVSAGQGRKLPAGAWIKAAKIEIISGDASRFPKAVALLDSLFLQYGPHSEGLYWMSQIFVDAIEQSSGPWQKEEHVRMFVAYADSLHQCCENKDIKKKYRKDCKKYLIKTDSLSVKYWREFYNAGVDQRDVVKDSREQLAQETDENAVTFLTNAIQTNSDSSMANMKLAIAVDPSDCRTYLAIGSLFEGQEDYEQSIIWLKKGLERTENKKDLYLSIAYAYINMNNYGGAIPYLVDYVALDPTNLGTQYNLSICYNNVEQYDSALAVYRTILESDPENVSVLSSMGRHYRRLGAMARDTVALFQKDGNTEQEKIWFAKVDASFDSSMVYFGQVFELKPDDAGAANDYAVVAAIRQDWVEAARGYQRLTEFEPDDKDNWVSLGDCNLYLKDFPEATAAYEKVVELDPANATVWERLHGLYSEAGNTAKKKEAAKKLKELGQ